MKKILSSVICAVLLCGIITSCASNKNIVPQTEGSAAIPGNSSAVSADVSSDNTGTADAVSTEVSGDISESGDNGSAAATEAPKTDKTDNERYSLEPYNGWWHHIGGTVAGEPVVEVIMIDAASGTWTEYSKSGIVGGTYTCFVNEMGLNLDYGDVGVTILRYDGISLINALGYIEYVPGDPIEAVSPSAYDGKWYLSGDTDAAYIEIAGDGYTVHGENSESGTWTSATVRTELEGGNTVEEIRLKLVSGDKTAEYVVADTGSALYDPENNTAYISENVLDTSEGDDLVRKYDLICHTWKGVGEDMPSLEFGYYENKFYLVNILELNGKTETLREACGTWSIHNYELSIHYSDGHEEITPYDPESIVFSYYNHMSFTKVEN